MVMRAMLEFQVRKRHPEISEREILWEVARLMYLSVEEAALPGHHPEDPKITG
jgi:hypothetical protein